MYGSRLGLLVFPAPPPPPEEGGGGAGGGWSARPPPPFGSSVGSRDARAPSDDAPLPRRRAPGGWTPRPAQDPQEPIVIDWDGRGGAGDVTHASRAVAAPSRISTPGGLMRRGTGPRASRGERPLGRTAASSVGSRARLGPLGSRAGPPAGGISAQRAAVRRKNKRAHRGAKRAAVREEQRHGAAPRRTPDARGAPARARALSLPPALARSPRRGASPSAVARAEGRAPARRFFSRSREGTETTVHSFRVRCARARRERTPLAPTRVRTRARRSNARAPLERDAAATPPRARAGRDP
jgi:hypothetical protein